MRIGGRVGFDRIDQLQERFRSIDFPIELALPWKYHELWKPMEGRVGEVADFFNASGIEILSIHATQGRITEPAFEHWGRLTLELARALGVTAITVHPNRIGGQRLQNQTEVLRRIRQIGGEGIISLETFGGHKRVFTADEIVERRLPMTLDVAHLHDHGYVMDVIRRHHPHIETVHLSSAGEGGQHLPIDDACVSVVDRLLELGWSGNVILEYLPWHHYRVRGDIRALEDHLESGEPLEIAPRSDHLRSTPERWGYNDDGTS